MRKLAIFLLLCAVALGVLAGAKLCRDTFAGDTGVGGQAVVHNFGEPDKAVVQELTQAAEIFPQFVADTSR